MPLWFFQAMFAVAVIATLSSGIWLLLHLTALASTFAGNADLVPAPRRPRASSSTVRAVLALFAIGLLATLSLMILVMTGAAQSLLQ